MKFKNLRLSRVVFVLLVLVAFESCTKPKSGPESAASATLDSIPHGDPVVPTSEDILLMYQIMKDTHEILSRNGVEYWLDGGSLLGSVRHHGMIPWDDDLDITTYNANRDRIMGLRDKFEGLGYWFVNNGDLGFEVRPNPTQSQPHLDIFLMEEKDPTNHPGIFRYLIEHWGDRDGGKNYITTEELGNLPLVRFGELMVHIPEKPELFLNGLYGKNWMTVGYQTHVHNEENAKKFKKVKIDLSTPQSRRPAEPTGPLRDRVTADGNPIVENNS